MRRSQKILTLLRIQFESANQKNKFLKKRRSSGDENVSKYYDVTYTQTTDAYSYSGKC